MGHKKTIDYWRHPTKREIKFGEGAIHWLTVDIEKVQKPDGSLKKWWFFVKFGGTSSIVNKESWLSVVYFLPYCTSAFLAL